MATLPRLTSSVQYASELLDSSDYRTRVTGMSLNTLQAGEPHPHLIADAVIDFGQW